MTDKSTSSALQDQAIAWVVRVGDPDFSDWEGLETWLSIDPAHAEAYHAAAAAEAETAAMLAASPTRVQGVIAVRRRRRWPLWGGAAMAASLVVAFGVLHIRPAGPAPRVYETKPGEKLVVALADASQVTLNGGTRLVVDGGDARSIHLQQGEGLFAVRHDEDRPFHVTVGAATVVDVGTRFDILREPGTTRIAVAEGAIDWRMTDGADAVRVTAGQSLRAHDGDDRVELAEVSARAVGGWARGELLFDGVSLAAAAADLARTLGVTIEVAPAIAARPVHGSLRLDGGADRAVPRFAALFGVAAQHDGAHWRLMARW